MASRSRITLSRHDGEIVGQATLVKSLDGNALYWQSVVQVGPGRWRRDRLSGKKSDLEVLDHMTQIYTPHKPCDKAKARDPDQVARRLVQTLYGVQLPNHNNSGPQVPVNMSFGALSVR